MVANDDLNTATKRLMDFVTDFTVKGKRKNEVLVIRGTYVELREDIRIQGKSKETDIRTRELRRQVLEFLDATVEENSKDTSASPSPQHQIDSRPPNSILRNGYGDAQLLSETGYERAKKRFFQERKQPKPATDIAFEGKGITKTYRSKSVEFALQPIDLQLRLGEITAVVGENGNGKTTLLRIVAGELATSNGTIEYPNLTLNSRDDIDIYAIKRKIAYIPQNLPEWPGKLIKMLYFIAAVNGKRGKAIVDEVDFIISRLGLEKYRDASWNELSGGFKTRFTLAKMLIRRPKLVVLDEPLANLDINSQLLFLRDLKDLSHSVAYPMAVIVSSQHLYNVEDIADNIMFLKDGQAIYNGKMTLFGEDRTENLFELGCDLQKNNLIDVLEKVGSVRIDGDARQFLVHTHREVLANDILEILMNNNVQVRFFRDVSRSTRRLFGELS